MFHVLLPLIVVAGAVAASGGLRDLGDMRNSGGGVFAVLCAIVERFGAIQGSEDERAVLDPSRADLVVLLDRVTGKPSDRAAERRAALAADRQLVLTVRLAVREQPSRGIA